MKTSQETSERETWFVLFSYGDARNTEYGWTACLKSEFTKSQAKKAGNKIAKRKGEKQFNYYFVVGTPYVTDSPEEFVKKSKAVGLNPNMEDYI